MPIHIRQETPSDFDAVFHVVERAFHDAEFTDHREQFLVQRLRNSTAFIPELSLVATHDGTIVGYVLMTKIVIRNNNRSFDSLALAPVAVLPEYQNQGIGGKLIEEAHRIARALNFASVIVLGHSEYYPKFGYRKATDFGIKLPFDVPDEYCMAIELMPGGLERISGTVEYPREFFE